MHIMIAGPYKASSNDPDVWRANLQQMNRHALEVFRKGHIPVIGVNAALPVIDVAGHEHYEAIMMPISLALAERCDAVLRIGGASAGADKEVAVFKGKNQPVYFSIDEIP